MRGPKIFLNVVVVGLLYKTTSSMPTGCDCEKHVFFPRRRRSGDTRSYWPSARPRRSGRRHANKPRLLVHWSSRRSKKGSENESARGSVKRGRRSENDRLLLRGWS